MWEAISSNRRRSMVLIAVMGAILVALGAVIGLMIAMYVAPAAHYLDSASSLQRAEGQRAEPHSFLDQIVDAQAGIYFGIAVATLIWLIMWASAVGAGDSILLGSTKARQISKQDAPQLWNIVEEMTIASGLGKMPRVYIIDDPAPNAFAVGYRPEKAAVAVTSGLLKRLNRDELQGVVAHEIGHIRNLDVRFMTLAGVMVGAIVIISHMFLRGMFYSSMGRRGSSRGGGGAQAIMLVVAIVLAILAPIAAQMLYFACSRRREYLADASSARFTRYPEGLASALEKISRGAGGTEEVNKVVAPMYIVNPLQARSAVGLFSTHPQTKDRVRILRSMAGAGFAAYEAAFRQVRGKGAACIGQRTLEGDESVALRKTAAEPETRQQVIERAKAVGEILDHVLTFTIIPCVCGVKLKLPPDFKRASLKCPRCGRRHDVPKSQGASPSKKGAPAGDVPMRYKRRGSGWESFQCGACGHPVQLSPRFEASSIACPKCHRQIEIVG